MLALQLRPDGQSAGTPAGARTCSAPINLVVPEWPDAWPLLVLDPGRTKGAGAFLAWCRRCDWKSPRLSNPGAVWAAFEAHSCQERP
jgi:hypothetical protein